MAELPIIVLAFANEQEGRRYLRNLPEELNRLRDIVKEAERNGLCRLEILPNATLEQLFDVFTRNRDQVAILHYGGHADSGRLMLESSSPAGAAAHATGLATFLGQCGGLQLVFLNGCSTRAQVARLLEAGVASVVATARAIDDNVAREFAVAFYTEMASGVPLRTAYEKARGRILAAHDNSPEAYYGHRELGDSPADSNSPDPTDDHGFPWEFRPGTELVERWSLPDAAGNPEFGLPRLCERDLPDRPFRHLSWFTAEHAEVFFGRGYQVRELYEQITDTSGAPILLLYGASGVGKSSLLDAGLVPRLEAGGNAVRYCRRDQQQGLTGTLRAAIQLNAEQTNLNEGWRAEEARLGKPLVIFLDQVEEVFTRSNPAQPRELDEFVAVLATALGTRDVRPRGKLVLGFRKEWLAELDRRLAEAKLPRTPVFLKQLDRRGIIEAIRGPSRPGRLERQYRLIVEEHLPEIIADNLLADAGSALAPTLQVLLTKMWERARQANPDQPRFDRSVYESLKADGYLLEDVLGEGLQAIGRWNADVESSGLALDLLAFHTTDLGTAAQHGRSELDVRYAHRADVLPGLLAQCKEHYLLIEAEPQSGSPSGSTRLAHDLLAPLVLRRFRFSVAPGERARRLLENRVPEWRDGKTGSVLDDADLATVDKGASGMRVRTTDENRLVEASQTAAEKQKAQEADRTRRLREAEERQRQAELEKQRETEQRLKEQQEHNQRLRKRAVAMAASLVLAIAAAVVAAEQGWIASKEKTIAVEEKAKANTSENEAILAAKKATASESKAIAAALEATKQKELAMSNLRIANAQRLAAYSHDAIPGKPQRSLILAVEAIRATQDSDEPPVPAARQALHEALLAIQGRPILKLEHKSKITAMAVTLDGRLAVSVDRRVEVWNLNEPTPKQVISPLIAPRHIHNITVLAISPDGRVAGGSPRGHVLVWNLNKPKNPIEFHSPHTGRIHSLAFARDGRLAASRGNVVHVWTPHQPQEPVGNLSHISPIRALTFASDGRLVTGALGGNARIWDQDLKTSKRIAGPGGPIAALAVAADGRLAIGAYVDTPRVLEMKNLTDEEQLDSEDDQEEHAGRIHALAFAPAPDGRLVTAGVDGTARVWDLRRPDGPPRILRGHDGMIRTLACMPDGRVFTASDDGTVRVWDLNDPAAKRLGVPGEKRQIIGLSVAPEGRLMTRSIPDPVYGLVEVHVLDLEHPGDVKRIFAGPRRPFRAWAFGTDGSFYTGSKEHGLQVFGPNRVEHLPAHSGDGGAVLALAVAPPDRLAAGSADGTVRLWDLSSPAAEQPLVLKGQAPIRSLRAPNSIRAMAFLNPDKLVTGSADGALRVYDLNQPDKLKVIPSQATHFMAIVTDGRRIVARQKNGTALVCDLEHTANPPRGFNGDNGAISVLAFAPDGRLVTGGEDGTARVWDMNASTAEHLELAGHHGAILALGFAPPPDGRLVTAGFDGTVRVWDLRHPKDQPLTLAGHQGAVHSLTFTKDGQLIAGGDGGSVKVWHIDLNAHIKSAEQIAGRNLTHTEWQQFIGGRYRRTFGDLPDGARSEESHDVDSETDLASESEQPEESP